MRHVTLVLATGLIDQSPGQVFGGSYRYSIDAPGFPPQDVQALTADFVSVPAGNWNASAFGLDSAGNAMLASDGSALPPQTAQFTVPDDELWPAPANLTVQLGVAGSQ